MPPDATQPVDSAQLAGGARRLKGTAPTAPATRARTDEETEVIDSRGSSSAGRIDDDADTRVGAPARAHRSDARPDARDAPNRTMVYLVILAVARHRHRRGRAARFCSSGCSGRRWAPTTGRPRSAPAPTWRRKTAWRRRSWPRRSSPPRRPPRTRPRRTSSPLEKAAADKAAQEKAAAEKAEADRLAAEKKPDKAAAQEKAAADRKAAQEKAAQDRADRLAAAKAEQERLPQEKADRLAAAKAEKEKANAEKIAEKKNRDKRRPPPWRPPR